jgi:hypothetical protein
VSEFSPYANAAAERSTHPDRPTAEGTTPHVSPQMSWVRLSGYRQLPAASRRTSGHVCPGRSRAPRQRAHDDEGERGPVCGMVWTPGPRCRAGLPTGSVLSELRRDRPRTCRHRTAAPPSGPIGDLGQAGRPPARSTVRSSPSSILTNPDGDCGPVVPPPISPALKTAVPGFIG